MGGVNITKQQNSAFLVTAVLISDTAAQHIRQQSLSLRSVPQPLK